MRKHCAEIALVVTLETDAKDMFDRLLTPAPVTCRQVTEERILNAIASGNGTIMSYIAAGEARLKERLF